MSNRLPTKPRRAKSAVFAFCKWSGRAHSAISDIPTPPASKIDCRLARYDAKGRGRADPKAAARAKAGELSKRFQSGERDLRAFLEHEAAEERARMETAARARMEAERQATAGNLQKLLQGYVHHFERQGKQSAQDVRNIFRRNVIKISGPGRNEGG